MLAALPHSAVWIAFAYFPLASLILTDPIATLSIVLQTKLSITKQVIQLNHIEHLSSNFFPQYYSLPLLLTEIKSKASGTPGRLKQFIRAPVRALLRFRDMYIRGMTVCADRVQCSGTSVVTFGRPQLPMSQFPSNNSFDNDLQQLISAAELRRAETSHGFGRELKGGQAVSRCRSAMAIRRIDEDREYIDEDFEVGSDLWLIPRSRSLAIGSKRQGVAHVHA